jgi:hypothetical protein
MKSVYIETSIVSYLTARPSPDVRAAAWQQLTVQWWEQEKPKYELFTSELVLAEPAAGDCEAAQRRRNPLSDPYVLLQDTPVPKSVHRWNCFLRRLKMYKDDIITEVRQNRRAHALISEPGCALTFEPPVVKISLRNGGDNVFLPSMPAPMGAA